jgi:serine/threonine-protein kinase
MTGIEARLRERLADRYVIERELGRGGMAVVYLAEDGRHRRRVAIKVLRPELAAAIGADRFLQEIDVAARLQHPHILPLYDSGEGMGILYYVMPYVAGETLRDRLTREKQLPVADAVQVACDVADALAFAHSHGVVHRDIKPENILFMGGHAVVADFGIARALDVAGGRRLTGTGVVLGTPPYMSPEQAGGDDVDGRSDVYALGCVLFEMLAGSPPFAAPTVDRMLTQHLTEEPPPVTQVRPAVPEAVAEALRRALAKTPADRHATARAFADALAAALPAVASARAARGPLRGAWWQPVAAVVAVAAAVFGWAWLRPPPGSVTARAEAIAVLPFVPVTADTALARLGRELAVTLSANLDGVGAVRTVEAVTVLAHVPEPGLPTPEDGAALARRLGASALLHGTLVRAGGDVRVDAVLSDAAALTPLARATVAGPPDDLMRLTDSATFAILGGIWRRGNPPAPNLAAITTPSVEALRAYLEGERAFARGDFDVAVQAFDRAIAADSTFWFAYWRSLYPRVYERSRPDSAVVAAVIAHRAQFPPADRLLIESQLADSLSQALAVLREATDRFPTYWPAWYSYADMLVHDGPMLGYTFQDARVALERVLALNPGFVPAWDHLFWYGAFLRDSTLARRAFRALDTLSTGGTFRWTEDRERYYGTILTVLRNGGRYPRDYLGQDAEFMATTTAVPPQFLGYGLLDFRFPQAQAEVNDAVLGRAPRRGVVAGMWSGKALSAATRGAWGEALPALREWLRVTDTQEAQTVAYGLAVTGAHLGSVDPAAALAFRPTLDPASADGPTRAELAWLDGLLAHARRDAAGLAEARRALGAAPHDAAELLERSLAAFALDLEGDATEAARRLAALERQSAEAQWYHRYGRHHPFVTSVQRRFAARGLLPAGDTAQAARLLTWTDAVLWNAHGFMDPVLAVFEPLALFERARIAAAQNRHPEAAALYRGFLERYDRPEGQATALVEEAVAAVSR